MAKRPQQSGHESYRDVFLRLLPDGPVWLRELGGELANWGEAFGFEVSRLHNRALELLNTEADPRTTTEMIDAWELAYGLPDHCCEAPTAIADRRLALAAKVAATGGQTLAYLTAVASALGLTLTLTNLRTFRVGSSYVGDLLWGEDAGWAFLVQGPAQPVVTFKVGDKIHGTAGRPLRYWGDLCAECTITKLKPAHTSAVFIWG